MSSKAQDDFEDLKELKDSFVKSVQPEEVEKAKPKKQVKFDESIESSIYENTVEHGQTEEPSPNEKISNIIIQTNEELPFAKSLTKKKEKPKPS